MTSATTSTKSSVKEFIRKLRRNSKLVRTHSQSKTAVRESTATTSEDEVSLLSAVESAHTELTTLLNSLKASETSIPNKREVINATNKLNRMLKGPVENVFELAYSNTDHAILRVAMKNRLFHLVPATCKELEIKTGVAAASIERVLRFLETLDLFKESDNGVWSTTRYAAPFCDDVLGVLLNLVVAEFPSLIPGLADFIEKHPNEFRTHEGPMKFVVGKDLWQLCAESPEFGIKIGKCMEGYANADNCVPLVAEWLKNESHTTGKFLDVGGGSGHVSAAIAKLLPPGIMFEIQDNDPASFKNRYPTLPDDIQKRLTLRDHDFFNPQPHFYKSDPVNAIFIRRALHDWSDEDAVRIIRNFIPVMEANPERRTALLINDTIMPERGAVFKHEELLARRADVYQWLYLNTKERNLKEWKHLLKLADPRLEIEKILYEDLSQGLTNMAVQVVRLRQE